jgi:O-antigen/teichoic acid export membrane protein
MPAASVENPPMNQAEHRAAFFRQSGWLMVANVAGGVFMWAVHFLNKFVHTGEYGSFGVLLAVAMLLPTLPLQMIVAQQTAKLLAIGADGELSGIVRSVWLATAGAWLVGSAAVLFFHQSILEHWHMSNPLGLWFTLFIVLCSIWMPVFWGVLQGQQNFLWLGWSMMINGVGRLIVATLCVLVLGAGAAGMMAGVLLGLVAAASLSAWHTRSIWLRTPKAFEWRALLTQVIPLTLAFCGFQILFTADTLLVKTYFGEADADFYVSAGTLSRALMWLVLPLAAVMFPRLVHSAARAEKSNLMGVVLFGTALLAVVGAAGLSVLGPFVVKLVYKQSYVQVASSILPWYAFAMVPLALANVLLNDLLARPASKLLLAVCVFILAAGYVLTLSRFHSSLVSVLQIMGACNLLLLGVCAWFSWGAKKGGMP